MSLLSDKPDVIKEGVKYWDCGTHKGYRIFYIETPDGDCTYLAEDNKLPKQWIASGSSLEDIGIKIDMIYLARSFK